MNRRRILVLAAGLSLGLAGAALPRAGRAQPTYTVSLGQLQRVLEQRFPLRYAAAGLLELRMELPRLRLLPDRNRVGSEFAIEASGPALRRPHSGSVDLDFALRYEGSDQTIRAHQIRVNAVQVEGLSRDAARVLDAYVRANAEQALLEVVLHRLRPRDLALASTMGFEPGSITVTAEGLVIGFVARTAPGS